MKEVKSRAERAREYLLSHCKYCYGDIVQNKGGGIRKYCSRGCRELGELRDKEHQGWVERRIRYLVHKERMRDLMYRTLERDLGNNKFI